MKKQLQLAFKVSRFRFWMYLAGPYFAGFMLGTTDVQQLYSMNFFIHLLYFLIFANVFLYGINDFFDRDTDQYNEKKETHEYMVVLEDEKRLKQILIAVIVISAIYMVLQPNWISRITFISFVFLSYAYSSPPFRFKAKPIIDFSSNILYVLPGVLGYLHTGGDFPPFLLILALFFWTGAMHLFSAVPDIEADRQANVITTAVFFGYHKSLWLCFVMWFGFASIIVFVYQPFFPWIISIFLYPLIPIFVLFNSNVNISRIYWAYPYINNIFGFALVWFAGWSVFIQALGF
jgi:lycopene elongase/hydratase (dihydrobisanhydrobacterioruberin-forming)